MAHTTLTWVILVIWLDPIDYKLLDLLQQNARMTQLEMAAAVGLSQPAVAERMRKLEQEQIITGYSARVDGQSSAKTSPHSSESASNIRNTTPGLANESSKSPTCSNVIASPVRTHTCSRSSLKTPRALTV